jgi:modulator of FtsH protease
MIESWDSFFVAETAAAAALLGLLFVAFSINLKQVIETGGLADRALGALLLLLTILVIGLMLAMPGQSFAALGIETVGFTIIAAAIGLALGLRGLRVAEQQFRGNFRWNIAGNLGALLPILIGGILIFGGVETAFYFIGVGMCLSIVKAVSEGWIFLVEINR